MLVCESLDRFMMLNEEFLAENILNEKLDINQIKDYGKKLGVLASMFLMFTGGTKPELANKLPDKEELSKNPIMLRMANDNFIERDELFTNFYDLLDFYTEDKAEVEKSRIFSAADSGFIDAVNNIKPGRLDTAKISQYDQFDDSILAAVDSLKSKGEDANPNLIKAIMLIETGMKPTKNHLGFEGFPQTKQKYIDGINRRYGLNFTLEDMYDPERAAEFIHYYTKALFRSQHVNTVQDLITAYNWGVGNLAKFKRGDKDLPLETSEYIDMMAAMQGYFPTA